ncbi:MAG: beta-ketoacyl synthase [Syntrophus sp. (in: bacteria)]|nr:beta-ketoacyl synthase [Syntrophus sp. (in: bacteria)]
MADRTNRMREVWITDAGVVTAAGRSLGATWDSIISGITAIKEINRFSVKSYRSGIGASISGIQTSGPSSSYHGILDLLLDQVQKVPVDSIVITATTKAGIDNLEKLKRGLPADPRDILLTSVADSVRARLGLKGVSFNVSAACTSAAVAVAQGGALISSGTTESVFICSIDIIAEFIFSGFSALQNLSPFPCRPFDRDRAGLSPGEGAAFLTLMSSKRAKRLGCTCKGIVAGTGMANDACHITAPDKNASGLVRAITGAIKAAGVKKGDIAGISAHGTGTIHNDLMELTAFKKVFGEACPLVYSVKGCIGHTFGASGGIEVALGTRTLEEQIIPPTVGFLHPEQGAEGLVGSMPVSITGDYLLTTNSGFGGMNTAIILKRGQIR